MKCMNCGKENEEGAKFCENCGSVLDEQETWEKQSKNGRLKYVIAVVVVAIAIGIGIYFALSGTSEKSYTDKIAMADKYVEKKDYKKAEEVYLEAIEIDPKQEDPYIKLSELYSVQNKKEKAKEILNKAEKAVTSTEGKKKIVSKKEEFSKLLTYQWIIPAQIESDQIYYVANGGSLPGLAMQFSSKYAVTKKDNHYGLIDMDGIVFEGYVYTDIIGCRYNTYYLKREVPKDPHDSKTIGYYYTENQGFTVAGDTSCGTDGGVFYSETEGISGVDSESLTAAIPVYEKNSRHNDRKLAIYNKGKLVSDFIYDASGYTSDGLIAVKKNGKWGYIDQDGNTVIPFEYDASWKGFQSSRENEEFSYSASGGYINLVKNNKWELRDIKGNLIIPSGAFDQILPVINNKCWVKKDGKWGVISLGVKQEEKEVVTETVTSEDYQNIYKPVLQEVSKQYEAGVYNLYYVHDIDKDGIKELLVQEGTCEADYHYVCYTIKDKKLVSLGEIPGGHSGFHVDDKTGNEPYIMKVYGHMGMEELSEVSIQDGKITENRISSRELGPNDKYFDTESIPYDHVNSYSLLEK